MSDVPLHIVRDHVLAHEKEKALVEAAASVANAIANGAGGMIRFTLMEKELRDALGLKPNDTVLIP